MKPHIHLVKNCGGMWRCVSKTHARHGIDPIHAFARWREAIA